MTDMKKYSKIGSMAQLLKEIRAYPHLRPDDGLLELTGSVKLHGSNAGVVFAEDGMRFQSRNRVLTIDNDNAGFVAAQHGKDWAPMADYIQAKLGLENFIIFGEYAGGNIQSGVAINKIEKTFFPFEIYDTDKEEWHNVYPSLSNLVEGVVDIYDFRTYNVTLDLNRPEIALNQMVELTQAVEDCCPVGKKLTGECGVGEGIVWKCNSNPQLRIKTKGQLHSKSNVKVQKPVDVERLNELWALVYPMVTGERVQQGLDYLKEMNLEVEMKSMGSFLKHVVNDCWLEEEHNVDGTGFERQEVMKRLSTLFATEFKVHANKV